MSRRRSIGSRYLLTLLLAVLPWTAVAQPWAGPERQVSPGGARPAVAADGRGNFIVAWMEEDTADIFVQRFSSAGPKLGEPVQVNTTTQGVQIDPSVAADQAGNFVVVWQGGSSSLNAQGGDGDGPGIFGQLFDANGAKRGGEFRVNLVTEGLQTRPKVAMAPDGRFAVAWNDERPSLTFVTVALRAFAADGRPFRYQIQPESRRDARGALVAMSSEGIILGWTESVDCGRVCGVDFFPYVQVFKADGLPRDRRRLMESNGSGIMQSVLAPRRDGDYLAIWSLGGDDLRAQRVTTSGQKAGKVLDLEDPLDREGDGRFEAAAMDAAGRFVVLWQVGDPFNSEGGLVGRLFDRKGTARGPFFNATIHRATDPQYGAVALADDGTFAVVLDRENVLVRLEGVVRRWFRWM